MELDETRLKQDETGSVLIAQDESERQEFRKVHP
jgi:hypothetical protein